MGRVGGYGRGRIRKEGDVDPKFGSNESGSAILGGAQGARVAPGPGLPSLRPVSRQCEGPGSFSGPAQQSMQRSHVAGRIWALWWVFFTAGFACCVTHVIDSDVMS